MNTPKYKKIYDHIVKLILTDEWPVGSNMKSENELINFFPSIHRSWCRQVPGLEGIPCLQGQPG